MSSFEDAKQALQNVLNNYSPSFIINKGCVAIFHGFFARCSPDEAIQFLPPQFRSNLQNLQFEQEASQPPYQPQDLQSTPDAFDSGSNSARTIAPGPTNTPSCERRVSTPCLQSRPMLDRQPIALTVYTPESFKKEAQQDVQLTANASKLIRSIKKIANKKLRGTQFYGALWDNGEGIQRQNPTIDPFYRYGVLQRMIDVSAETEYKHIYRQRIAHILGAHELEIINQSIPEGELSRGVSRKSLAVDKLSKTLGKTRKEIHEHNTKRRHYLSFYFEIGPGAIPLLGDSGNKELLEKSLTGDDVTNALRYIQESLPNWLSLCQKINFEVATAILKALQISGWDGRSHYETAFMTHLGKFIDLDTFQKHGDFRPVSRKMTTAAKRKREANLARDSHRKRQSRSSLSDRDRRPPRNLQDGVFPNNSRQSRDIRNEPDEFRPFPYGLESYSCVSASVTDSGQSEASAETDVSSVPSSETPAQIFSTAGPSEYLSRDRTPDQSRTSSIVDNLDIGRNLNIDLPASDVANEPALEGRHQTENLDTDWTQFSDTRHTAENLDLDWLQLLQDLEYPSENLDLDWAQFLPDVERPSENLDVGWTQQGYIRVDQSR